MNFLKQSVKLGGQGFLAVCIGAFGASQPGQAAQLADGMVHFIQPPALMQVLIVPHQRNVPSTYYFTIEVPANAGESLQRLTISEQTGVDGISYDLQKTRAFEARPLGQQIPVDSVMLDPKSRTVSITFSTPVSPGRTVTVALRTFRNPFMDGVYGFGVTAFPPGENAHGQFLGFRQVHLYK